jgi:hypothetical protein
VFPFCSRSAHIGWNDSGGRARNPGGQVSIPVEAEHFGVADPIAQADL